MLTLLNEARTDYEVVDVLDEQYNPGVREAIKTYSQWPTIPQVCLVASKILATILIAALLLHAMTCIHLDSVWKVSLVYELYKWHDT